MFQGEYHGSRKHEPDLDAVLARAFDAGVERIVVTGGSVSDSQAAIALANTDGEKLKFSYVP
jgi:TatD DNase family protein